GSATERQALIIKNDNSNGDSCWVFFGSDKPSKEKSVIVASGDSYVRYWPFVSSDAMQATCASSSDSFMSRLNKRRNRTSRRNVSRRHLEVNVRFWGTSGFRKFFSNRRRGSSSLISGARP